jgi:hypothetical protein
MVVDLGIVSITTKPYNEFVANAMRDNMGSKKFSLQSQKRLLEA